MRVWHQEIIDLKLRSIKIFFIRGICIMSPSTRQGVHQTFIDCPFQTICPRTLIKRYIPCRILRHAKKSLLPSLAVRKSPLGKYFL